MPFENVGKYVMAYVVHAGQCIYVVQLDHLFIHVLLRELYVFHCQCAVVM